MIDLNNIDSTEYVWLHVLPDDFYEDGIYAIWKRKDDNEEKPIQNGDKVLYHRLLKMGGSTGKVLSVFTVNERNEELELCPYLAQYIK